MGTINVDTPFKRKVRRLSVQKVEVGNTQLATSSISQVRSFIIFSPVINQILPLSRFEVLRVLDLDGSNLGENGHLHLSCVGDLLHLRYLGLAYTKLHRIPMEIGKLMFFADVRLGRVGWAKRIASEYCSAEKSDVPISTFAVSCLYSSGI
jgi:hypothetical protein